MINQDVLKILIKYFLLMNLIYFDLMLIFLNLLNILLNQTIFYQLKNFDQDVMNVNYLKNKMHLIQ